MLLRPKMNSLFNRWALAAGLILAATTSYAQSDYILVENFRNVNCANCKEPDEEFDQWLRDNPQYKVALVYYHNEITDVTDPFYKASKGDVDFRDGENFYNVTSNPVVFVRGFFADNDADNWKVFTQNAGSLGYPVQLQVSDFTSTGSNTYSFKVNVSNPEGRNVRVYAALVENGIAYNNPKLYGNPGTTTWENIFRKMLPDRDGTDPISGSNEFTFSFDATEKPWNVENMHIVAWAQDVATQSGSTSRTVHGTTVYEINLGSVAESSSSVTLHATANPFVGSTQIVVEPAAPGQLLLEITDVSGAVVTTIANELISERRSFEFIAPQAKGMYFVRALIDGVQQGTLKVVSQ